MNNKVLLNHFMNAQQGDQNEKLNLITQFDPLIRKYTCYLKNEDARSDLICFFLNFIQTIDLTKFDTDAALIKYISISFNHEYIRLSKALQKISENEILLTTNGIDNILPDFTSESDNRILSKNLLKKINIKERYILYLHYILDYSITDIAQLSAVSRQAINKQRKIAEEKIKHECFYTN